MRKSGHPGIRGECPLLDSRDDLVRGRVIAALLALAHTIAHLLLPGVVLLLLVVGQDIADLGICAFTNAAAFGAPVIGRKRFILHQRLHLRALVFENGFDLGLLVIGKAQPFGEALELIVNTRHAATLAALLFPRWG